MKSPTSPIELPLPLQFQDHVRTTSSCIRFAAHLSLTVASELLRAVGGQFSGIDKENGGSKRPHRGEPYRCRYHPPIPFVRLRLPFLHPPLAPLSKNSRKDSHNPRAPKSRPGRLTTRFHASASSIGSQWNGSVVVQILVKPPISKLNRAHPLFVCRSCDHEGLARLSASSVVAGLPIEAISSSAHPLPPHANTGHKSLRARLRQRVFASWSSIMP